MTLLDRLARAIAEAEGYQWAKLKDEPVDWRDEYRKMAQAALKVVCDALREPSEEMIDAVCEAYSEAFEAAEEENRERYEALKTKYPELPAKEKHGAAGCQTFPVVLRALATHLSEGK